MNNQQIQVRPNHQVALALAIAGWLGERARNATQQQLQVWGDQFANAMINGGANAMEEVRNTVREIVSAGGQRLGGAVRSSMNQLQNGVIEFSSNFMQQFDDDGNIPDLGELIPQNPDQGTGGELAYADCKQMMVSFALYRYSSW